jgi:hypothetical protein
MNAKIKKRIEFRPGSWDALREGVGIAPGCYLPRPARAAIAAAADRVPTVSFCST